MVALLGPRKVAVTLLLALASAESILPAGYSLTDESADHDGVAKSLANANRLNEAIESFRAAARFVGDASSYANLGVALMRNKEWGLSWQALSKATEINPADQHAKQNFKVLYDFAGKNGIQKADLEKRGQNARLSTEPKKAASATSAAQESTKSAPKSANKLVTAEDIAERARDLFNRGEKKLGRGFLSLALHINPWIDTNLPWVTDYVAAERPRMTYWKGNIWLGLDKTKIEDVTGRDFADMAEPHVNELALLSWRNLQLVKHSCCGIDNVAVFLSRARSFGHPHLIPFLHLTPDYPPKLKAENKVMYSSFKQWWENNGRRPAPAPRITFDGKETWDWEPMKVVMPANRVPDGWEVFTQAVLCYRRTEFEGARHSLMQALNLNPDLSFVADEFMPGFASAAIPRLQGTPTQGKYVICYAPQVGLGNVAVVLVSCQNLAKLTGRTLVIHWNSNTVQRTAWEVKEQPGVKMLSDAAAELGAVEESVKGLYMFHMMESKALGDMLELLGCQDPGKALEDFRFVTVSTNLYFTPILQTNPNAKLSHNMLNFAEGLGALLQPSHKAKRRALSYANKTDWAKTAPVIAIHIRSREEGEDNDDWPTAESPEEELLVDLANCVEKAVQLEWSEDIKEFDVFIAATTEKARKGAAEALKTHSTKLRRVLMLPKIERNRKTGAGVVDAMAEALLVSRADVFVRFVVGTTGFSTFAFMANALRLQPEWAADLPQMRTEGFYAPNYVVTSECASQNRCFEAGAEVRMADVAWHGRMTTTRSCGDVIQRLRQKIGCSALKPAGAREDEEEL